MHYKFCSSPRDDALQVLSPSERAWAVQRSRCRAFLEFDARVTGCLIGLVAFEGARFYVDAIS